MTESGNLLPPLIPFSQAAVPMDQVFQSSGEAEEAPAADAGRQVPMAAAGPEVAGETPEAARKRQVYVVGGISAAASFILVLLGYFLFGPSKPKPAPEPKPVHKVQLPVPPAVPVAPVTPVTPPVDTVRKPDPDPGTAITLKPQDANPINDEQTAFDAVCAIPDAERDRKAAALTEFIEKYKDTILVARARNERERLVGPPPELPLEPATQELKKKASGLTVEFFQGRDLRDSIAKQVDLQICLDTRGIRPSGVPQSDFSARWQGYLYVEKDGVYTVTTVSDDGVRLKLGGRTVISNWGDHGAARDSKTIALKPGYYSLVLEYYQGGGDGEISLRWSMKDGFDERIITADNLFHERGD